MKKIIRKGYIPLTTVTQEANDPMRAALSHAAMVKIVTGKKPTIRHNKAERSHTVIDQTAKFQPRKFVYPKDEI